LTAFRESTWLAKWLPLLCVVAACKNSAVPVEEPSPSEVRPGGIPATYPSRDPYSGTQPTYAPPTNSERTANPSYSPLPGQRVTLQESTPDMSSRATIGVRQIVAKQVFQRNNQNSALVSIATSAPQRQIRYIRMRVIRELSREVMVQDQVFDLTQTPNPALNANVQGGGWYRFEVTYHDVSGLISEIGYSSPFGVGEVFVVAGQSNSTNCGSTPIRPTSDMVISTDGQRWQFGEDPQIGTNDFSLCSNGSSWPSAGDELVRQLRVPVAFASTGYSGTSVAEWQPGATKGLYGFTLNRMRQLGARGFRAVLWHQGETDVYAETPQATYAERLMTIIRQSHRDLGVEIPWIVAQAAWCRQIPEYNKPQFETPITSAQASLPRTYPFVFAGPNTDALTESYRSTNCHFNERGAVESGRLWARAIVEFLQRAAQVR
jgi:hypothetical protein